MHSSALRALECIAWGRSATSDCKTSDAEIVDTKISDGQASESIGLNEVNVEIEEDK